MEIASGLPFDIAAVEARPAQGQSLAEPFRDCLGSAVGRARRAESSPPETGVDPGPEPARVEVDGETGTAVDTTAEAAETAGSDSSREVTAAEAEPGADRVTEVLGEEPSLVALPPAPPAPELPPQQSHLPQELAAPVAAAGDAGVTERPSAPVSPPGVEFPSVPEPGADQPPVAVAEQPAQAAEAAPAVQIPDHQLPDPVAPSGGAIQDPATVAAFQAVPGIAGATRPQSPTPERDGAGATILSSAADLEEAEVRTGKTRGAEQPSQGRFGAERLWGYWLRHGGGGASRSTAAPGSELTQGADPGPRSADAAPAGAESSRWQALMQAAGGAGAELGAGEAAATGPETRAEPIPAGVSPEHGNGVAHGPERVARASAPVPRTPTPPPQPHHQVANAVRVAVLRGGDQVTVQLEPETLGRIHVVLMHGDEGVRAQFRVENPLTHQALQADAPQLKQALEARGVNVAHVSVELEQGDRQERDPLGRHSQGRRRRFGGKDHGEVLVDDLALHPRQWRPWGFEARA